jgi:tetratricopeptide (TPR) repeat protein/class 3 adenylate cyclase
MPTQQKLLRAIMFTDMKGFTEKTSTNQTKTLKIRRKHNAILDGIIPKYHGTKNKEIGDAYFVTFPTVADSAICAIKIQQDLLKYNQAKTPEDQIVIRIGLHFGDVVKEGEELLGDVVNFCKRIESEADPGGISVSHAVYEELKNQPDEFSFDGPKECNIRGKGKQNVYKLTATSHPVRSIRDTKINPERDRQTLPPVRPLPAKHRMPYPSLRERFVGRVNEFWELHDLLNKDSSLQNPRTAIIVGTGGLGKSQMAVEYIHRFGVEYPGGVYWVDASRGRAAMSDQIAEANEIDGKLQEEERIQALWKKMSREERSLIVLDNFPNGEALLPWLPPNGEIQILVTTLRHDLTNYDSLSLPILTLDEGLELLNSGKRKFGIDAKDLVGALGGLPLVLEIVRHYLNLRPDLGVKDILSQFKKTGALQALGSYSSKYRDLLPTGHEKEIAITIQLSYNQVSELGRKIVQAMSLLAPSPVPRRVLYTILADDVKENTVDAVNDAISELVNDFSLVDLDADKDPKAHILVLGFAKETIEKDSKTYVGVFEAIIQEMARANNDDDTRSFRELEKALPHAQVLIETNILDHEKLAALLTDVGRHHRNLGRYRLSEKYNREAMALAQNNFEPGHPSIATSQSNLALVLQDLGQLEEARDLLREALASNQKSYEPGHQSIAACQSNLALVLRDLGELKEARDLLREALASDQQSYEPGHPSIATIQSNLATVLQGLGQLEEARDLLREALASNQKSYEPGHPSIAIRQSNLATVLQGLGQLEEARDLLREALASDKKNFEPGHPSIAISQSNLALVLQDLGQLKEARDLLRQALASNQKSYEPGHPNIATIQSNLALVLRDLGQLEEARDLLREALASDKKNYESAHLSIARSQSNLALVLRDLGQLEEARDLLREALASDQQSYEPGHPSIAKRQSNLAGVLQDLGQSEEARDLLREALASDKKSYEPGHPSITIDQSNLALVLKDLGQLEEARDLLREALVSNKKSYEPGHPYIATSQSNLATVLQDLGQLEEARDLLREALASDKKSYEPGHHSIATRQSNLALVLKELGQLEEARKLLEEAYQTFYKKFGPDHRNTKIAKENLEALK